MVFCGGRASDVLEPGVNPKAQKRKSVRRSRTSSAKVDPFIESPSREGLTTAPAAAVAKVMAPIPASPTPARVSSAPAKERKSRGTRNSPETFVIENELNGVGAEEVDEYISSALPGSTIAADLRSTTWADRLRAVEMLQARVESKGAAAPDEREKLFKVCVTILARVLHDKIVPVYLPALQLLQTLYATTPGLLAGLAMLGACCHIY